MAANGSGSATGADHTFTTAGNPPPGVSTGPATQISKNAATLTAVVSPNKQATTYYFQYGAVDQRTARRRSPRRFPPEPCR